MADDPEFDVPVGLFEDMEDLKAQVARLSALVKELTEGGGEPDEALADEEPADEEPADEEPVEGTEEEEEEEWQYPPFILLLESPAYDNELRALAEWVEGVLVPGYLGEPSADSHWCHVWFEHPVAIARLHALWLAWQELTDPATCGHTGPSVWHRDHFDPCMRELRGSGGPFAGCTKNEHQVVHRMPGVVPSAWRIESS